MKTYPPRSSESCGPTLSSAPAATEVTDSGGVRIWLPAKLLDATGGVKVGSPQIIELALMECRAPGEFKAKHLRGQVPEVLFCNVRIEVKRSKADALDHKFVNAIVLAVQQNDRSTELAPNMSHAWIRNRMNNGFAKDDGIVFGRSADLQMNDISGIYVTY